MGGDFTEGTGKGGKSIYEEPFPGLCHLHCRSKV
jgi:hypothetical protein